MKHPILFRPSEYRDLSTAERELLETAYQKAKEALRRTITPKGFSACSAAFIMAATRWRLERI
jgi:hypothetical protein